MPTVRVPAPMVDAVGGLNAVDVVGATVGAALQDLARRYPEARERLFRSDGTLHPHLMVVVDGSEAEGMFTPVAPGSEIIIIPAIGGGRPGRGGPAATGPRR